MILVTGGTGFLGGHLLRRLQELGRPVRVLCRKVPADSERLAGAVPVLGDIEEPHSLPAALLGVRHVVHVAGLVDFNPDETGRKRLLAVNEVGACNLLAAASEARVETFVHVSSVSTIGGAEHFDAPLCEDDFGMGRGVDLPYPYSKRRGELAALEAAKGSMRVVIVNPTFFAGPGDVNLSSARTIVSFLKRQVWVGLSRGGMGYTDVRDVAAGIVAALDRGQSGRRYILGGHNLRLSDYHRLLGKVTGLRPPFVFLPPFLAIGLAHVGLAGYRALGIKTYVAPGDIRLAQNYWVYRYDRAREELGLRCRSPEESLVDAVAWLRAIGLDKF